MGFVWGRGGDVDDFQAFCQIHCGVTQCKADENTDDDRGKQVEHEDHFTKKMCKLVNSLSEFGFIQSPACRQVRRVDLNSIFGGALAYIQAM